MQETKLNPHCLLTQNSDIVSQDKLVESYFSTIKQKANYLYNQFHLANSGFSINEDDLFQEGCIGLLRAIERYKEDCGAKFNTFADHVIQNAMISLIRSESSNFVNRVNQIVYLDDNSDLDKDISWYDIIPDGYHKTPEQIYLKKESLQELGREMACLSKREQTYLSYRFGIGQESPHTKKDSAAHYNLSESRANKLENKALRSLRKGLTG